MLCFRPFPSIPFVSLGLESVSDDNNVQYSEDDNGGGKVVQEQRVVLDVFLPFTRKVSIIPLGRGSPRTKNEGAFQNTVLRSAVDLLEQAVYFPFGKILGQTIYGYESSGYYCITTLFIHTLLRRVYEHAKSNEDKKDDDKLDLLILVVSYDRLGRDEFNISMVIDNVLKFVPDARVWSIREYGMSWVEAKRHIPESKLKRREVYDSSRSAINTLHASVEDNATGSRIINEVKQMIVNSKNRRSDVLFRSDIISTDEQNDIIDYAQKLFDRGNGIEIRELSIVVEILHHMTRGRNTDLTTDGALRAILDQVPLVKSSSQFEIEYYRSSRYMKSQVLTKVGELPFNQFIHILAIKRILQKDTSGNLDGIYEVGSRCAIYDDRSNRTTYGLGLVKMVTLIAAGQAKCVIVMKGDRMPVKMMQLFLTLCHIRSVKIVSVKEYGKNIADISQIEFHRQNALRSITDDINDAKLASKDSWSKQTLAMNDSLCQKLVTLGKGWDQRGNQRGKGKLPPTST